jgi:protein-S-isoprenylcysteine O-methyltransferase Ste14
MKQKMTRWGIGPKFTFMSIVYSIIIAVLHFVFLPDLTFVLIYRPLNIVLGTILIITGIPVFVLPACTIDRYFHQGKLCTKGVYSYIRHPIYGAWIVCIVPGLVLIIGSIIGITIPIFMYCLFRLLIVKEERYLEEHFGDEYRAYKKNVGALFPKVTCRR